jgi:hypothetical protein
VHADAPDDAEQFQRYLTGICFGDIVARSRLDPPVPVRELLTFSMLAGLGAADARLRGYVTGNLNVGDSRARLLPLVLTVPIPCIGYPAPPTSSPPSTKSPSLSNGSLDLPRLPNDQSLAHSGSRVPGPGTGR